MKKRGFAVLIAILMTVSLITACGSNEQQDIPEEATTVSSETTTAATNPATTAPTAPTAGEPATAGTQTGGEPAATTITVQLMAPGDIRIALITMDSEDQYWHTLNGGAQRAATELGTTVTFMSPDTKGDTQQIESINRAVAEGYHALIVAANGPESVSGALNEAVGAGLKLIYVDSPADVPAEATFSTDYTTAGHQAGLEMINAFRSAGISSGNIGIVNADTETDTYMKREIGFRIAIEGSGYTILPPLRDRDGVDGSQSIAEDYIAQGAIGIFAVNETYSAGLGNAIKAAGDSGVLGVGFGTSDTIQGFIDDGTLLATIAQNPDIMGYESVKAAVEAMNGRGMDGAVVNTGALVVTMDPS